VRANCDRSLNVSAVASVPGNEHTGKYLYIFRVQVQ
jgi:hypothetical protein